MSVTLLLLTPPVWWIPPCVSISHYTPFPFSSCVAYQLPLWLPDSLNSHLRLWLAALFGCRLLLLLPMRRLSLPSERQIKFWLTQRDDMGGLSDSEQAVSAHRFPTVGFPTWVIGFFFCCFFFFFVFLPAAHWWVLVAISLFPSFSLARSCSSQLRWNWKFVGLKFEMVLLNILYTLLGVWKSWGNVGNKAAGEDDDVKRKYFHFQLLASKYERSVWEWKDIIWLPFKPVEVLLKWQLYSAPLVTFCFSVLSLL